MLSKALKLSALLAFGLTTVSRLLADGPTLPNPILFVTQVPIPSDFTTIGAVFGNHQGRMDSCGRGGDLWIRYGDGTLRNLTRAAGYGGSGLLTPAKAIAVREPSVHWSGNKALFSMVVGAPSKRFEVKSFYWQIYEITGFGQAETPVITLVPNQPANFNNVSPLYGTDDRIIFTSDRPRNGQRHLYPQLDEYEEAPVTTGLWSMDPQNGDLFMLNHVPSGAFTPTIDSFGRVLFTRWDHLQRDQQADADRGPSGTVYGTFNYSDETANALVRTNDNSEIFPESRLGDAGFQPHTFNQFFPWQIHEDGTEEEIINHMGRHEFARYIGASLTGDPNVREFYDSNSRFNTNAADNILQLKESPAEPGTYYATQAPEFSTHAAGQIIRMHAPPSQNPDKVLIEYLTPKSTSSFTDDNTPPPPDHTGMYRNPLPLVNGMLAAIHTSETRVDKNQGDTANPVSRYQFRLKTLKLVNGFYVPDQFLTPGLTNSVQYYDPDTLVSQPGQLWELDPVEVRSRPRPTRLISHVDPIERGVFEQEGVDPAVMESYLKQRGLALIISRNVTQRDRADKQQPYNLRVPGGTQTLGANGKVYDISYFQLYQADQIRGKGLRPNSSPVAGRRVLAQRMHEPVADNPVDEAAPESSVPIASDGSIAAFVPARRAMTWQTTAADGKPVVRERYWLTFQPGEIRTCTSCHGVNTKDQAGQTAATNAPIALRDLLRHWKNQNLPTATVVAQGNNRHLSLAVKRQKAAALRQVIQSSTDLAAWKDEFTVRADGSVEGNANWLEKQRSGGSTETIQFEESAGIDGSTGDSSGRGFNRIEIHLGSAVGVEYL